MKNMFRTVPTKQVNRLAKYQNITTKKNPQSYKVLPTGVFDAKVSSFVNQTTTSAELKCYFSTSTSQQYEPESGSSTTSSGPQITYVNSSTKAPKAIGPYSQGVKANGNFYVSGCLGIVAESGELAAEDTVTQARQALANLKYILEEGGCSLKDVVKTTVYLLDINDFQAVNEVYSEYFSGDNKPARVCYAVAALPKKAKVEIEAIAIYKE
nr:unnamed protein product [Naegleria fowleri]